MLNQFMVIGKAKSIVNEKGNCILNLIIPRSFKNAEGIYEDDLLVIQLFKNVSDIFCEKCEPGNIVAVKGRIQNNNVLIAERITFLSENEKKN